MSAPKFVQAKHFGKGRRGKVLWLVIHDMEMHEGPSTAESCAQYFATTTRKASAHYCIDENSVVKCVHLGDTAWAAGPAGNMHGIHFEIAGFAAQSAKQWQDASSAPSLVLAAKQMAKIADDYGIPATYRDAADLEALKKGVTTHRQISYAFRESTHEDPGPGFPMDVFLVLLSQEMRAHRKAKSLRTRAGLVAALLAAGATAAGAALFASTASVAPVPKPTATVTASPSPTKTTAKPTPTKTTAKCKIVGVVGYGDKGAYVKVVQRLVGADADGVFGSKTRTAVKAKQRKLKVTADGLVGKTTATKLGCTWAKR